MKIRSKLILVIFILVIISITISGTIYYFVAKNSLEARVEAQLESVSILKKNQFDDFMQRRLNDLGGISQEKLAATLFSKLGGSSPGEASIGDIRELLEEELIHQKDYFEAFIIDLDGKVIVSTDKSQERKYKSSEPYFTMGKKKEFIQYFYYDLSLQQPAITISTPIKNDKGDVVGVLAGRVDLNKISKFMTETSGLGETGETYLVNKFNLVVTDLRTEGGTSLKKQIQTAGVKNCLKGQEGFASYDNYQKTSVVGYHVWIPESEICLLTEISQKEAFLPIRKIGFIIILINFGIISLTAIFIIFLSNTITNPLFKLKNTAVEIGRGKLDTQIEIESNDEIGQLASEFAKMVIDLKKSRMELEDYSKNLEKKVKARTEELERFNKLAIGRELKMVELKKRIKELEDKLQSGKQS